MPMRPVPGSTALQEVREAFIAGASIADTPTSPSSWSVVIRFPGARRPASEAGGRVPIRIRDAEPSAHRISTAYPGTVLAAEWFACLQAIRIVQSLDRTTVAPAVDDERSRFMGEFAEWPRQNDAAPLRLYTTRAAIVECLEGRVPLARRKWLREVQDLIAHMIDCRVVAMGDKYFFRPADRPYPGRKPRSSSAIPVYAQVIKPDGNRRATRVAREALRLPDRPEISPWW
jgi:hypothetical protein